MTTQAETNWSEQTIDGVDVIRAPVVFEATTGERITQRIVQAAQSGQRAFIVDLTGASDMDPMAVIPLVRAARRLQPTGVRISVVFDPLLLVFGAPGIEAFHDVAVTVEDALTRISPE